MLAAHMHDYYSTKVEAARQVVDEANTARAVANEALRAVAGVAPAMTMKPADPRWPEVWRLQMRATMAQVVYEAVAKRLAEAEDEYAAAREDAGEDPQESPE